MLQSHILRTDMNGTWHKSNEQIDEDLTAPFSADRVKSTSESFDSTLTGAGNPLVRQLGGYYAGRQMKEVAPRSWLKTTGNKQAVQATCTKAAKSPQSTVPNTFRLPRLTFSVLLLNCEENATI